MAVRWTESQRPHEWRRDYGTGDVYVETRLGRTRPRGSGKGYVLLRAKRKGSGLVYEVRIQDSKWGAFGQPVFTFTRREYDEAPGATCGALWATTAAHVVLES
jgi:hypothetical protein